MVIKVEYLLLFIAEEKLCLTDIKKKCNLPEDFKPYATRHTFITRLVEAGNPPNVVKDLAGHKCIETTFTFYAQSSDKALKKAITSINKPMSMIGHNRRKVD